MFLAFLTLVFLAENNMPEGFMGWLIAGLLALIGLYREVQKFGGKADNVAVGPQPFKVAAQAEFVEKGSFNKHLELDRKEHEKDRAEFREEHEKIWRAIEANRREHSNEISRLLEKVTTTAALMDRVGEEVKDAARVAHDAATAAAVAVAQKK